MLRWRLFFLWKTHCISLNRNLNIIGLVKISLVMEPTVIFPTLKPLQAGIFPLFTVHLQTWDCVNRCPFQGTALIFCPISLRPLIVWDRSRVQSKWPLSPLSPLLCFSVSSSSLIIAKEYASHSYNSSGARSGKKSILGRLPCLLPLDISWRWTTCRQPIECMISFGTLVLVQVGLQMSNSSHTSW